MQPHKIVSHQEWIEARKALLAHEKELTRARDRLSEERRALPWVKVDKPYPFDSVDGNKTLSDLFEGRPARGPALHVRAGMERGLQELLLLGRRLRAHDPASGRPRHDFCRRLPRPAGKAGGVQEAHGLDLRLGLIGGAISISTMPCRSHRTRSSRARSSIISAPRASAWRRRPASACSIATRRATSSTPIPASPAAST